MNRVLYAADCLDILNDPGKLPTGSIDLIYLDPPFNSNSTYNLPFKSRDRSLKPVEAFEDTWRWRPGDEERLRDLEKNPQTRALSTIVKFARQLDGGKRSKTSLAAYLLNMALRLSAMKRVLKDTGSIYLHCDPTASHYLKLIMDGIFGRKNFRNEITWKKYGGHKNTAKVKFTTETDSLFFYVLSKEYSFSPQYRPLSPETVRGEYKHKDDDGRLYAIPRGRMYRQGIVKRVYLDENPGVAIGSLWADKGLTMQGKDDERLGYPTQKPLALLERIIKASSKPGDIVLDPFCGCGTTVHAAETLGRKWIGIDISKFSTGLIRRRIVDNFAYLNRNDILIQGTPESIAEARALAQQDKFEFEKWVCGAMDANGMYKHPGKKGADGGVDGVVELPVIREVGNKFESQNEYVIIQVKGGNVAPDSVKALSETVRRLGAIAGIMVCFRDQMSTVDNQRSKDMWSDAYKQYPVIQGFSIEDLLDDQRPNLPPTYGYKHGGKTSAVQLI